MEGLVFGARGSERLVGEEATSQEQSAVLGACRALPVSRYPLGSGGEDGKVMWRWRLFKCWHLPAVGLWWERPAGQDQQVSSAASIGRGQRRPHLGMAEHFPKEI